MSQVKKAIDILRVRRLELRLSQEELALRAGTYKNAIYLLEKGKKQLSLSLFFELCKILDLKPWDVLKKASEK